MEGNPQIILFDIGAASWKLDEYKQTLWSSANIGIPHPDIEANDAVILGFQVATFINEVMETPLLESPSTFSKFNCTFSRSLIRYYERKVTCRRESSLTFTSGKPGSV